MKKILLYTSILILLASCGKDDEGLSEEDQLAVDIELIDEYLSNNAIDAQVHESEIRYVVEREGTGDSPVVSSRVIVKYDGRLLDGTQFDANDLGTNLPLSGLIDAWQIMIPEMKEGGKITIYTPSKYAYGNRGLGNIPPNSVLVFEIELVSLVRTESEQLAIDLEAIDAFLERKNIAAEIHSSGIRYQTLAEGTGLSPTLADLITVNYVGKFLSDEDIFDQATEVDFRLTGLIDAWKTMVPTMQEGGKIIVYAPSGFCYGADGNGINIAPNENLIFEIELLSIRK